MIEMEYEETQARQSSEGKIEVEDNDSRDKFQKFIYDLFDKNGILNDLRAYLRGHIVNVLKSAQTGDPPMCHKNYVQRLELASQAFNILIAEYLLQSEFTYSLSVFVSEIPLSNMVFDFAKTLLKDNTGPNKLRFKDSDVWSVLNYMGVKCDSEHAMNIVDAYKSDQSAPLLRCILSGLPMYHKESVGIEEENSSRDSLTSSANSLEVIDRKARVHRNTSCHGKCKHYAFCKACQERISRLKDKYKEKKKGFLKETRKSSMNPINVESFMKNINIMEKRIINEMFEQLQSVYEAEVGMVRRQEEGRAERELQRRLLEMEESLKTKEAELESSAQHKKRLLWGVARALRQQHDHVTRAMALLAEEREKLAQQESSLKTQLSNAEETLRKKGEEMRVQISKELEILEANLEAMKRERDSLNRERSDLEQLKIVCESRTRIIEADGEKERRDLKQHYDLLKDEIAVLRKYIETTNLKPKCVIERNTITEYVEVSSSASVLNNTSCPDRHSKCDLNDREARPPNQLVNDLKKQKNINFNQGNTEEVCREDNQHNSNGSQCSASSDEAAAGASGRESARERDAMRRLIKENEKLKHYARQTRWQQRAPRPRTAPPPAPARLAVPSVNPSTSAGAVVWGAWRSGAGEALALFPPASAAARVPLDDNRRLLINQWRALKSCSSRLGSISKARGATHSQRVRGHREVITSEEAASHAVNIAAINEAQERERNTMDTCQEARNEECIELSPKSREKSPKTVLKEAKEKLRTIKENLPAKKREKNPNSMLREAKLRLRKLEIEAEAVEKSYLDFRKRQAELREERKNLSMIEDRLNTDDIVKTLDMSRSVSFQRPRNNSQTEATVPTKEMNDSTKIDFDKYLRDYRTKFDISETHFKNRNTAIDGAKPIPKAYSEVDGKIDKRKEVDYLTTPLIEFRKLYHAEKERKILRLKSNTNLLSDMTKSHEDVIIRHTSIDDSTNVIDKGDMKTPVGDIHLGEMATNDSIKHKPDTNINPSVNNENPEINAADYTIDYKEIQVTEVEQKCELEDMIKYSKLETLRKIKNRKVAEFQILKENINKIYNLNSPRSFIIPETSVEISPREKDIHSNCDDKNVLRVEVESSCEVNKVKMSESQDDELFIVVQSVMSTKESDESDEETLGSIPLVVNISPKEKTGQNSVDIDTLEAQNHIRSESPEKAAHLTRDDALNAIFQAEDNKNVSSVDVNVVLSTDDVKNLSDSDKDPYEDYPDDFSADVDNYNYRSHSEYENNSPISLPKSSENDNFWDN